MEGVVPSQPFSLKERPEVLPPRGLLPENPGEWLEGGGWRGVTHGLVWDAGATQFERWLAGTLYEHPCMSFK